MPRADPETWSQHQGTGNRPLELSSARDNFEENAGEETEEDDEPQGVVGERRMNNALPMEVEDPSGDPATSPFSSHRRARSLNSITLRRPAQLSGKVVVTRTGLMSQANEQATTATKSDAGFLPDRKSNDPSLLVSQLVDDARSSLNEMVDEAKHSLEEWAQTVSRRPDRKYRRSLRWYGSAANISNETMVPATYDDTVAIDDVRCALLDSSRRLNPIDIVLRLDLTLTASILPRVVRSTVALIVFGAYAVTAVMKRFAYLSGRKGDEDDTVVKLSIFVSFIIVFYSNHCYTRFYRQYESVKLCSQLIADAVTVARSLSVLRPAVPCGPTGRAEHTIGFRAPTKNYAQPASAPRYDDATDPLPVVAPTAAPYLEPGLLLPNEAAVARYNTVGGTVGSGAHAPFEESGPNQDAALSTPPQSLESAGPYLLPQQPHLHPSLASQRPRANLVRSNEATHSAGPSIVTSNHTREGRMSVDTLEQLYRYLNVAHVAGYTALSPTYTRENLFEPFVKAHRLLTDAEWRAFRRERLDVEDPSGAAFHEFVLWAVTAVAAARERGEITSPNETVSLQDVIMRFRGAMQSLHDEKFQEIPFSYSHLVSFICATYLFVLAVDMGLKFGVKEPLSSGLIFPALAVFFTTVVLLGLLILGKTMSQPTGLDPEAFPIFTYLESTAIASSRIIHPRAYKRHVGYHTDNAAHRGAPPRHATPSRRNSAPPTISDNAPSLYDSDVDLHRHPPQPGSRTTSSSVADPPKPRPREISILDSGHSAAFV